MSANQVQTIYDRDASRAEHNVSRDLISKNALKVLYRLNEGGFEGYLVGGGVRDILTGLKPKDFDVATDATPEEVKSLFRNSRIIGRRFRLVHVLFGREVIEVATFRAAHDTGDGGEIGESGRILRDNVFGTIEEDARRRDFSVNALYYRIDDFSVIDYVGGLEDIERKTFCLIGDPVVRCEEDPVRILRAARLAAKLGFEIEADTLSAMHECAHLLSAQAPPRMFEEVLKLFQGGYAIDSFNNLIRHELLQYLFPATAENLADKAASRESLIRDGLRNTDNRVQAGKPVTPAYLLAFLLWHDVHKTALKLYSKGTPAIEAILRASDEVLPRQLRITAIPKRFSGPMREIWSFQPRLEQYTGRRALSLLEHRRFRAAYDFLCLRSAEEENLQACAQWWTEVQELEEHEREEFTGEKVPVDGDWQPRPRSAKRAGGQTDADGNSSKPKPRRRRRRRTPRT